MDNKEVINWLTRIRDRLMTTSSKQFEAMTIAIAALEQREKAFDEWCTDCKEYDHNRNCCPRYNRVIRGAVDEVKQQGWIPVTERLPEECEEVNITWVNTCPGPYYKDIKDKPFTGSGLYCKGRWYWYSAVCKDYLEEYWVSQGDDMDDDIIVTAWRPLPEPYQEDKA